MTCPTNNYKEQFKLAELDIRLKCTRMLGNWLKRRLLTGANESAPGLWSLALTGLDLVLKTLK